MIPVQQHQFASLFGQGPVLVLIDGSHDAHRGLTDPMRRAVVCVQLAGPTDRDLLTATSEFLDVTYGGPDGKDQRARLARAAIFCVARRVGVQPHVIASSHLPRFLGPDPQVGLHRLLMQAGILQPTPVWSYPDSHAELDKLVAPCPPDKRMALEVLRAPGAGVWLQLRPDVEGLRLVQDIAQLPEHSMYLAPDTLELRLDNAGIHWRQMTTTGLSDMHVPWLAIAAMRTPDAAQGWFWPLDLAPATQVALQKDPTVWQRLVERTCVAQVKVPELPALIVLSPRHTMTPQEALQRCQDHGGGLLLVDRRQEGVLVPASLRDQPVVAVPMGMPALTAMVVAEPEGITATMPDADGRPALLRAPWTAILSITSLGGVSHGTWSWPDHAGAALLETMAMGAGEESKLLFEQPCGPRQPHGQPMIRVEFQMQRRGVH